METARCLQDGSIYSSQQFTRLPATDLWEKRRYLVCPECGGPAFFRKQSHDGREPCFGARPHSDGCNLKAAPASANACERGDPSNDLLDTAKRLVVDFGYGAAQLAQSAPPAALQDFSTQREQATGSGVGTSLVKQVRLRPLLRYLMSTQVRASQQIVDVAGVGTFAASELFVPFDATTPIHYFNWHGFFGAIVSAYFDRAKTLWLNSRGQTDLSICVSSGLVADLYSRFRITEEEDLVGANVLAFGHIQLSQQGKKYIVLNDIRAVSIDLA